MVNERTAALAKKAIRGNKRAFESLCKSKEREMFFHAYTILGNHHDAEDIVQETIFSMFRNIGNLKDPNAIDAWIIRIIKNNCTSLFRKQAKHIYDVDIDDEDEKIDLIEDDRDFLPEAYAEDKQERERIYKIVQQLPEKRREAILMYYYNDLSYKEIADINSISIDTVASSISKARAMIKKELKKLSEYNTASADNKDAAMLGLGGATTVMGRILKQEAETVIPKEALTALDLKWVPVIKGMKYPVAAALPYTAGGRILISAAAICVVSIGGVVYHQADTTPEAPADPPPPPAMVRMSESEALKDRMIVFTGSDCDCGHINPDSAKIANIEQGDQDATYEISDTASGEVTYSGEGTEASLVIEEMIKSNKFGKYKILFALKDRNGNKITLDRVFEIIDAPEYEQDEPLTAATDKGEL